MGSGASVDETTWKKWAQQLKVMSTKELSDIFVDFSPKSRTKLLDALALASAAETQEAAEPIETVEILCKKGKKMRIADAFVGPFMLTMCNVEDRDLVDDDSSRECSPLLAVTQKDGEVYRFRHTARQNTTDMDAYFMISWDVGSKEPDMTQNGSKESLRDDVMWCADPAFVDGLQRLELNATPALGKFCPQGFDELPKEAQAVWWQEQEKTGYIQSMSIASFLPILNSSCRQLQVLELSLDVMGFNNDAAIVLGGNARGTGKDGMKESGLAAMENLRRLRLSLAENRIGDEGATALGAGIKLLRNLESLTISMSENHIESSGAMAMCMHIASLNKVASLALNFHNCDITDSGVIECCKHFQSRGHDAATFQIMELVMTNCKITGGTAGTGTKEKCVEALKEVPNYRTIRVDAGPRDPKLGNHWRLTLPP